jgi:hypothetical protein
VVAVCTTSLTFTNLRSAHTMYLCFWMDLRTDRIISLYSINWLVSITETECVYCAVRTGSLYIIRFNLRRLVSGLSLRRPGFNSRQVHRGVLWDSCCSEYFVMNPRVAEKAGDSPPPQNLFKLHSNIFTVPHTRLLVQLHVKHAIPYL